MAPFQRYPYHYSSRTWPFWRLHHNKDKVTTIWLVRELTYHQQTLSILYNKLIHLLIPPTTKYLINSHLLSLFYSRSRTMKLRVTVYQSFNFINQQSDGGNCDDQGTTGKTYYWNAGNQSYHCHWNNCLPFHDRIVCQSSSGFTQRNASLIVFTFLYIYKFYKQFSN